MKVELLCLGAVNKPSPIFEGVAEIRINSQPCKGINLTTRHTQARRESRVATIHDEVKETIRTHLTLVHVFHAYALVDTPWVAHALSHFTSIRYGNSFCLSDTWRYLVWGFHISRMQQYIQVLVHSDPTDVDLNRHRRGLPPWSSEY
jgi:hypothetical protein